MVSNPPAAWGGCTHMRLTLSRARTYLVKDPVLDTGAILGEHIA